MDTERVYTEVTQQILDKYADGVKFTWDVKSQLMGRSGNESAAMVVDTYKLPMSVKEYLDITAIIQEDLFPHAKLLPGVEKLIRHLHAHDIPIAVATSSTRSKFELKTSLNKELFELFDVIICGDDAEIKNAKPSPDLFLAAQKHFGNPPAENCLVFEDAVNGVEAGLNAKMNASSVCMCAGIVLADITVCRLFGFLMRISRRLLGTMIMALLWSSTRWLILFLKPFRFHLSNKMYCFITKRYYQKW